MRSALTTGLFWADTAERAVKTAAQALIALIGTDAVGITDLDWAQIGSVAATAAVLSVLSSVASDRVGPSPGPSVVGAVPALPPPRPTFADSREGEAEVSRHPNSDAPGGA